MQTALEETKGPRHGGNGHRFPDCSLVSVVTKTVFFKTTTVSITNAEMKAVIHRGIINSVEMHADVLCASVVVDSWG